MYKFFNRFAPLIFFLTCTAVAFTLLICLPPRIATWASIAGFIGTWTLIFTINRTINNAAERRKQGADAARAEGKIDG